MKNNRIIPLKVPFAVIKWANATDVKWLQLADLIILVLFRY